MTIGTFLDAQTMTAIRRYISIVIFVTCAIFSRDNLAESVAASEQPAAALQCSKKNYNGSTTTTSAEGPLIFELNGIRVCGNYNSGSFGDEAGWTAKNPVTLKYVFNQATFDRSRCPIGAPYFIEVNAAPMGIFNKWLDASGRLQDPVYVDLFTIRVPEAGYIQQYGVPVSLYQGSAPLGDYNVKIYCPDVQASYWWDEVSLTIYVK